MSKITLAKAKIIIKEIKLLDAFASVVNNTITDDVLKLSTYNDLSHKIFLAEMNSGILETQNQIDLLEKEQRYYEPNNLVFYYKEHISDNHKDNIKQYYDVVKSDIRFLKDKIRVKEEKIYIRID